jgi:hypothetical protein
MKRAIYCALVSALIGFAVAAWVATANPPSSPRWMSTTVAYALCPAAILAGITTTDPSAGSVWLSYGPLNALIYGAVGYTAWLFVMGDDANTAKKENSNRPLGL